MAVPARVLIVTRPRDQAQSWVEQLGALGLHAAAVPLLGIEPVPEEGPLRESLVEARGHLARWDLLVFVSPNAVEHFLAVQVNGTQAPASAWPSTTWVAAPGPGTAAALRSAGVAAERILQPAADAPQFDSASLWEAMRHLPWRGRRVLIVRGEGGRDELMDRLQAAGAEVSTVCAYRRGPPVLLEPERAHLLHALQQPHRVLWLFSSSQALAQLPALVQAHAGALAQPVEFAAWAPRVPALATHPRILEYAQRLGFVQVQACRPGVADVAAAAAAYNAAHREP